MCVCVCVCVCVFIGLYLLTFNLNFDGVAFADNYGYIYVYVYIGPTTRLHMSPYIGLAVSGMASIAHSETVKVVAGDVVYLQCYFSGDTDGIITLLAGGSFSFVSL